MQYLLLCNSSQSAVGSLQSAVVRLFGFEVKLFGCSFCFAVHSLQPSVGSFAKAIADRLLVARAPRA